MRLNPRQQSFCRLYVSGPQGIRGNGQEAYKASGYNPKSDEVAKVNAAKLLTQANVQAEIARLHREADASSIARLKDWKALAPPAQDQITAIMLGRLQEPGGAIPITADNAPVARLRFEAAKFIIERAYPSKLFASIEISDPADTLARLLGVPVEAIPQPTQPLPEA